MKTDLVMRVCYRIEARYHAREAGTEGWWGPILGRVRPDDVVAMRGPWPLQRHVIAHLVAGLGVDDDATVRGPAALLDGILEEALALRAGIPRERLLVVDLSNADWGRLASASSELNAARFEVEQDETLGGVELRAGARWCFGFTVPHADVEIDVVDEDAGVFLHVLDGRQTPPSRRRVRLHRATGPRLQLVSR